MIPERIAVKRIYCIATKWTLENDAYANEKNNKCRERHIRGISCTAIWVFVFSTNEMERKKCMHAAVKVISRPLTSSILLLSANTHDRFAWEFIRMKSSLQTIRLLPSFSVKNVSASVKHIDLSRSKMFTVQ